ncbi:MAG: TetR/AcrR family transcriptional regulator, partial [Raoultibacter sp.]
MPEQRVDKTMILDAALVLVRTEGESALSARLVAAEAGCSVQPIYSLFSDMANLTRELYDYARFWVAEYNRQHAHEGSNLFEANGFSHLRLAATETNLFHFLYLSKHMSPEGIEGLFESVALEGVVECI